MTHHIRRVRKARLLIGSLRCLSPLLIAVALPARGVAAQDSTHARQRARTPGQPPRRDTTTSDTAARSSTLSDTTHLIHITVDTAHVDSSALDTLRRAVIRDSIGAVNRLDSAQNAYNCQGRRITRIDIRPQPPFLAAPSDNPRLARFIRRLTALHSTTRGRVIRRFLAFRVGDVCEETRRTESERLLRAQPFIERVRISAFPDGPDGVRLDVFTVDAVAGEIGIGVEGRAPLVDLVRLGNGNLLGDAIRVSSEWARTRGYRDHWEGDVTDYQLLGHPWVAAVTGDIDHVGGHVDASVSHPYFTSLQTLGWRVAGGNDQDFFQFRRPAGFYPSLDLQRTYANAGALFRVGSPGRFEMNGPANKPVQYSELALVGAALSHEIDGIGGRPVHLGGNGPVPDTTVATAAAFADRYAAHNVRRVNGLVGFRAVRYLTVRGFDALLGEEDVPLGVQASGVAGRSVPWFGGSGDPDIFVSSRLDVAGGTSRSVVQGGFEAEGRRNVRTRVWDGLVATGHAAWYLKTSLPQTFIFSADAALGDRVRVPFQLALADPQGGVEGYGGSRVAGSRRIVARAEYRHLIRMPVAVLRSAASWGLAGFATGGRVWAGDVPFGVTSPFVAGAGAGLLVGFPRNSRQLWRVDIAAPVVAQPHAGWEVRVSTSSAVRVWWTEPSDVSRSRERTVSPALFSYP
jgi:hypothetical protein